MHPSCFKSAFEGQIALVTGAAQGNGRAIALGLSQAGFHVLAADRSVDSLNETVTQIHASGGSAEALVLDITDLSACHHLKEQLATRTNGLHLLVNNAGVLIRGRLDTHEAPDQWQQVMNVNVQGTFNVTYACLDALKKAAGHIVNISSITAFAGQAGSIGYAPSKGAIKQFTQSLAAELAEHRIRVNAIAPGVIATAMSEVTRHDPARLERFMMRIPMNRVGTPEELVGPVLFLASPLASYITGATLAVDGGFLAV